VPYRSVCASTQCQGQACFLFGCRCVIPRCAFCLGRARPNWTQLHMAWDTRACIREWGWAGLLVGKCAFPHNIPPPRLLLFFDKAQKILQFLQHNTQRILTDIRHDWRSIHLQVLLHDRCKISTVEREGILDDINHKKNKADPRANDTWEDKSLGRQMSGTKQEKCASFYCQEQGRPLISSPSKKVGGMTDRHLLFWAAILRLRLTLETSRKGIYHPGFSSSPRGRAHLRSGPFMMHHLHVAWATIVASLFFAMRAGDCASVSVMKSTTGVCAEPFKLMLRTHNHTDYYLPPAQGYETEVSAVETAQSISRGFEHADPLPCESAYKAGVSFARPFRTCNGIYSFSQHDMQQASSSLQRFRIPHIHRHFTYTHTHTCDD
jgi:hypothetical protein